MKTKSSNLGLIPSCQTFLIPSFSFWGEIWAGHHLDRCLEIHLVQRFRPVSLKYPSVSCLSAHLSLLLFLLLSLSVCLSFVHPSLSGVYLSATRSVFLSFLPYSLTCVRVCVCLTVSQRFHLCLDFYSVKSILTHSCSKSHTHASSGTNLSPKVICQNFSLGTFWDVSNDL